MHLPDIPVTVGQDSIAGFVGIVRECPYKNPYSNLDRRRFDSPVAKGNSSISPTLGSTVRGCGNAMKSILTWLLPTVQVFSWSRIVLLEVRAVEPRQRTLFRCSRMRLRGCFEQTHRRQLGARLLLRRRCAILRQDELCILPRFHPSGVGPIVFRKTEPGCY
jgi:hypothetical protein